MSLVLAVVGVLFSGTQLKFSTSFADFFTVGVIKKAKDYLFLFMLLCVPWFWIWGWRLLTRVNYLNILLFPVNAYNRYIINKYGHDSSRIILKNLKSSQKSIEEIKARLESIKPEAPKEVNTIREEIRKKLENTGTKYN